MGPRELSSQSLHCEDERRVKGGLGREIGGIQNGRVVGKDGRLKESLKQDYSRENWY